MGLDLVPLPDPLDHHARDAELLGEGPHAPVRPGEWPRLQGGVQDALLQVRGQDPPGALAPGPVAEGLDAPPDESHPRGEHGRPRQARLLRDRPVRDPLAGQQDHLAPPGQPLRRGPRAHQGVELLFLAGADRQRRRGGEHGS
jgi:hypothetical protein